MICWLKDCKKIAEFYDWQYDKMTEQIDTLTREIDELKKELDIRKELKHSCCKVCAKIIDKLEKKK